MLILNIPYFEYTKEIWTKIRSEMLCTPFNIFCHLIFAEVAINRISCAKHFDDLTNVLYLRRYEEV